MFTGFDKIVEERIKKAQRQGAFENLDGTGKPLNFEADRHIPEELRTAYKILKNADCLPPEIEIKKEIIRTEELLAGMEDSYDKYRALKKLNFLIMKLNTMMNTSMCFEIPQKYESNIVDRISSKPSNSDPSLEK